jgi:hypothetical protein
MSKKAERKCQFVLYVLKAPENLRKDLLENSSITFLKIFCEVILNIVDKNLESDLFLLNYKDECKLILRKSHSIRKKREIISTFGTNFYNDLSVLLDQYV